MRSAIIMIIGPPYDPIISRIIPIFILYSFLFPLSYSLSLKLIKKGSQKQSKAAKFLGKSFFWFGTGVFIAFLGLLEVLLTSQFKEVYRLSLPLGYSAGIIGNLYLFYFGFELYGFQRRLSRLFIIWTIISLILINLNCNWYGVPYYFYEGKFSLRPYSSLNMTFFSIAIYINIIIQLKPLTKIKSIKSFGFKLIIWSLYSFIVFWACMTLDAVSILISGEGFSIFTHIAWTFATFFWLLSYSGLTMPKKIRKYIEKHNLVNNQQE